MAAAHEFQESLLTPCPASATEYGSVSSPPRPIALLVCVLLDRIKASSRVLFNPSDKKSSWGFEQNSLCSEAFLRVPSHGEARASRACCVPRPGGALVEEPGAPSRDGISLTRSFVRSFVHSFVHSLSRWPLGSCSGLVPCSVPRTKLPRLSPSQRSGLSM